MDLQVKSALQCRKLNYKMKIYPLAVCGKYGSHSIYNSRFIILYDCRTLNGTYQVRVYDSQRFDSMSESINNHLL